MADGETKFLLNMGDGDEYDLNIVGRALGFARDFAVSHDVMNAAKNMSSECKTSPLVDAIEDAISLLQNLFQKYAQELPTDESASPASDS